MRTLQYTGVLAPTPPNFKSYNRDPTSQDCVNWRIGDLWLREATENIWMLSIKIGSVATWTKLTNAGTATFFDLTITNELALPYLTAGTLRSDNDGVVSSLADGINLDVYSGVTGSTAEWSPLRSAGATVTITRTVEGYINFEAAGGTAANSYTTDGPSVVVPDGAGNVNIFGGSNITTDGSILNTIVFDLNDNVILLGDLSADNGYFTNDITAGATVIATGDIISTTGDIVATLGNIEGQDGTFGGDVDITGSLTVDDATFSGAVDINSDLEVDNLTVTALVQGVVQSSAAGVLSSSASPAIPFAINSQVGTTYTLVLGDASKEIQLSNANPIVLTVPLNAGVAFPVGTQFIIVQYGAGTVTVTPAGGVTINSAGARLDLYEQYSAAALIKQALPDTWLLCGDIA